jgi:hypothetical protein
LTAAPQDVGDLGVDVVERGGEPGQGAGGFALVGLAAHVGDGRLMAVREPRQRHEHRGLAGLAVNRQQRRGAVAHQ